MFQAFIPLYLRPEFIPSGQTGINSFSPAFTEMSDPASPVTGSDFLNKCESLCRHNLSFDFFIIFVAENSKIKF